MNRLYIVEGLPCSGKSSTSQFIADMLREAGRPVCCIDEGTGQHPADYENHVFINGQILPLNQFPLQERSALLPRKIYDGLPWHIEAPLMLEKWRQFVCETDPRVTYVFNSVLLQNPMCETMMRFNLPEDASTAHICAIAEIIRPLFPVVIYLHNDDVAAAVRRTSPQRPGWLEAVMDYHITGSYGRSIGAAGFEGYIACLEERQCREERILQRLPLQRIILDNPQRNWTAAYASLRSLPGGAP